MAQTTPEIRGIVARYVANLKALGVPVGIYLFGSQARQDAGGDSDLDLAVVSPLFEKMNLWDRAGYLGKAAWDIRSSDRCPWVFPVAGQKGCARHAAESHHEERHRNRPLTCQGEYD